MKKISTITFLLVMMLTGITVFSSCSDSDDDLPGGLSSWYSDEPSTLNDGVTSRYTYNFIGKNTVVIGLVYNSNIRNGELEEDLEAIPDRSGWYRWEGESYEIYVVEDNKIIITNGDILTIVNDGDELYDGNHDKYTRW